MNFQVIEGERFTQLEQMFSAAMQKVTDLANENFILKNRYLSAEDVAVLTGYNSKTIKLRKDEIGYFTQGKDIKFTQEDVKSWMDKYYIRAKRK